MQRDDGGENGSFMAKAREDFFSRKRHKKLFKSPMFAYWTQQMILFLTGYCGKPIEKKLPELVDVHTGMA